MNKRPKKDIIVAVRMPRGLVDELKDKQNINHFMDMSDEIRFIVRKYCTPGNEPTDLSAALVENKRKEKLIDDLNNIINQLKRSQ
jgi:hypothetical protein